MLANSLPVGGNLHSFNKQANLDAEALGAAFTDLDQQLMGILWHLLDHGNGLILGDAELGDEESGKPGSLTLESKAGLSLAKADHAGTCIVALQVGRRQDQAFCLALARLLSGHAR
jgi:hypothetical protein